MGGGFLLRGTGYLVCLFLVSGASLWVGAYCLCDWSLSALLYGFASSVSGACVPLARGVLVAGVLCCAGVVLVSWFVGTVYCWGQVSCVSADTVRVCGLRVAGVLVWFLNWHRFTLRVMVGVKFLAL